MSAKQRADLIKKLHRYCKKEFDVIKPPSNRLVIEHMVYACCLENSTPESADDAFAKLQEGYYDWNEVRVTTDVELAETMSSVADPQRQAISVKKALHGLFETWYQFDLEFLRKENLGKSVAAFEKFKGVSPFVVSYTAQHALGGHSIPLDRAMMLLFFTLGIVSESEATKGRVPGLERTIPKAKGIEFSTVVHQLAVQFYSAPFSKKTRDQLLQINKDAKELFPKRATKKKVAKKTATAKKEDTAAADSQPKQTEKKTVAKKAAKKTTKKKTATKSSTARTTKASAGKSAKKKTTKKKKAPIRKKLSAKPRGRKSIVAKQLAKRKPK